MAQLKTTYVCLRGWGRWDKGLPEDSGSKGGKLLPVGTATPIPILLASSYASARALKGHFLEKDQEEGWSPRQHTQSVQTSAGSSGLGALRGGHQAAAPTPGAAGLRGPVTPSGNPLHILAWEIPWMGEPVGLRSTELPRAGHY